MSWLNRFFKPVLRMDERRRQQRARCSVRAVASSSEGALSLGLTEVSLGGASCLVRAQLKPGTRLELMADQTREWVACEVVWCRPAGVRFQAGLRWRGGIQRSWLRGLLGGRLEDARHHRRFPLQLQATIRAGSCERQASLIDVGLGGAQLRTELAIKSGEMLSLHLGGKVEVAAAVVNSTRLGPDRVVLNLRFLRNQTRAIQSLKELIRH